MPPFLTPSTHRGQTPLWASDSKVFFIFAKLLLLKAQTWIREEVVSFDSRYFDSWHLILQLIFLKLGSDAPVSVSHQLLHGSWSGNSSRQHGRTDDRWYKEIQEVSQLWRYVGTPGRPQGFVPTASFRNTLSYTKTLRSHHHRKISLIKSVFVSLLYKTCLCVPHVESQALCEGLRIDTHHVPFRGAP